MKSLGQIDYEAYCEARGWKSFTGDDLPQWDKQNAPLRLAWEAGASAVEETVLARLVRSTTQNAPL